MIIKRIKLFSDNKEEKKEEKSKLTKAGKATAIAGGTAALAGGIAEAAIARKNLEKAADKVGGYLYKGKLKSLNLGVKPVPVEVLEKEAQRVERGVELAMRATRRNKAFKIAKKADLIGTGAVAAGLAAYGAGKYLDKKKKAKAAEDNRLKAFSKKELSKSDKFNLWASKHLASKYENQAYVEAFDKEGPHNASKLAKVHAGGHGLGGVIGGVAGSKIAGSSNRQAALMGAGMGLATAAGGYLGVKMGYKANMKRVAKDPNGEQAKKNQKAADIAKVSLGKMSKEEFIEKYGKEKKDK